MIIQKFYFVGHAFPEPISGGGKQDGYVAAPDYEQLERTAKMLAEALIRVIENKWEPDKYHMATHDALAAARKDGLL
jgi:hypothetical protein